MKTQITLGSIGLYFKLIINACKRSSTSITFLGVVHFSKWDITLVIEAYEKTVVGIQWMGLYLVLASEIHYIEISIRNNESLKIQI